VATKGEDKVTNPEISVVMATYRQRRYLAQAVESIEAQNPNHRLLIVGVHGEEWLSYQLLDWLKPYEERVLGFFNKEPNLWKQRQAGLDWAYTPYLCFFDSDDVMLPGWLEKGLKVAEEIKSRGKIPIVGPSYRMVDEKLFPVQDVILPEFSMDRMMEGCVIPDFSITTTEALRSVGGYFDPDGYDPGHPMYSYSMWLRLLRKYGDNVEVKLLPDIGFLYRQHHKSMHNRFNLTKKRSAENVRRAREVARHYFPNWGTGNEGWNSNSI
jgi:glycosyltransferase involved in cell wall biosynthesis